MDNMSRPERWSPSWTVIVVTVHISISCLIINSKALKDEKNADSLKMSRFLKDSPYQNFFLLLKVVGIFRPLPHNGICRLLRLLTSLLDTGRAPTLPKLELASSTFRKNIANGWIRNSTQRCFHYKIIVKRFSVIIKLNIKITEAFILGSNGFFYLHPKRYHDRMGGFFKMLLLT